MTVTHSTLRGRLMASSMISGALAALSVTSAHAQAGPPSDATTTPTASATVGEIVVTGSRIPQQNLTSTSPLSVVSDKEIRFEGAVNVESFLQNLPSVQPEFNQGVDNGASGTATVSLRGLGSNRTLVLVNGARLMPGDPILPSPDLNNIPAALVDHVEVITGGASAVYGSDAVAGVVNFIMRKNFEGVRVDAQYGFADHHNGNTAYRQTVIDHNDASPFNQIPLATDKLDAMTYTATVILGVNAPDGKGNITAYAGYRNVEPLDQGRRDAGVCGLSTVPSTSSVYDTHTCFGSSNSAFGRFVNFGAADNPDGSKTFVPFTPDLGFNFGPYNYYQQHDETYTAGYFARYEITPHIEAYSTFLFADDQQISNAAPSGLFTNNGPIYAISCNNPLASAAQLAVICGPTAPDNLPNPPAGTLPTSVTGISDHLQIGYRFQGIPRVTSLSHTAYTATIGLRGRLDDAWSYDVSGQFGKTAFRTLFTGDVSNVKINDALNAVPGPSGPVCASENPGCVPLDIFQALGKGLSPESIASISAPALKSGGNTEQIVTGSLTGQLGEYGIKSPWANDGVGIAFGGEYRRETLTLAVDNEFATGDLSGAGGVNPPANGAFDVKEVFGELRAPLIEDAPFAKTLSFEAGYRFARYSASGDASAYKASAEWAPVEDIRFRGGYNRAVRAPNIVELFNPQVVGNASFGDPCQAGTKLSFAQCALTGVTAAEFAQGVPPCAAAQCSSLTGGNPELTPERADTYTIGAVIRPRMIPGLNLTADYFYIKIANPISILGGATILSQCLNGVTSFCGLIHRAPDTGALFGLTLNDGYVIDINENTGHITTSGIDVGASYRLPLADFGAGDYGSIDVNFLGTYTAQFERAPFTGAASYECIGFYGLVCGQPQPVWKHQFRVTWNAPWNLSLSANWRFLGPVKLDVNSSDPSLAVFGVGFRDSIDARIPAFSYFDLAATWRVREKYTLRAGINNILDKDPPAVDANNLGIAGTTGFGNGNTFPGVYDTIGRTIFIGLTADF